MVVSTGLSSLSLLVADVSVTVLRVQPCPPPPSHCFPAEITGPDGDSLSLQPGLAVDGASIYMRCNWFPQRGSIVDLGALSHITMT